MSKSELTPEQKQAVRDFVRDLVTHLENTDGAFEGTADCETCGGWDAIVDLAPSSRFEDAVEAFMFANIERLRK